MQSLRNSVICSSIYYRRIITDHRLSRTGFRGKISLNLQNTNIGKIIIRASLNVIVSCNTSIPIIVEPLPGSTFTLQEFLPAHAKSMICTQLMTYFMHNKINIKSIALWNPICRRSVSTSLPNGILIVGETHTQPMHPAFPPPPVAPINDQYHN
jgi:hypothetical protein